MPASCHQYFDVRSRCCCRFAAFALRLNSLADDLEQVGPLLGFVKRHLAERDDVAVETPASARC